MGFVDKDGARALYINSGVNDTIIPSEIKKGYVDDIKFLHLTSFVGEKSFQTQKPCSKTSRNCPRQLRPRRIVRPQRLTQLEPILRKAYVVMPNRGELELITGYTDYVKGADALIAMGVKIVAVKLGGEGSYVTNGRDRVHSESFKVKVVDTTGAGDAFCAGFLYGLLQNEGLKNCGRIGNFVASRCVMKLGARAGLPYKKDLARL